MFCFRESCDGTEVTSAGSQTKLTECNELEKQKEDEEPRDGQKRKLDFKVCQVFVWPWWGTLTS